MNKTVNIKKIDFECLSGDEFLIMELFNSFKNTNYGKTKCYCLLTEDERVYSYNRKIVLGNGSLLEKVVSNRFSPAHMLLTLDDIRIITEAEGDSFYIFSILYIDEEDLDLLNLVQRPFCCEKFISYMLKYNDMHKIYYSENRNIRKAKKYLTLTKVTSYKDYKTILFLGNRKTKKIDSDEIIDSQVGFLTNINFENKIIAFASRYNDNIVAGIICVIINNVLFLIVNNYNEEYLKYRANDFLYYAVIKFAYEHNVSSIDWGEVSINDIGLQRFKSKYSCTTKIKNSLHFLKKQIVFES